MYCILSCSLWQHALLQNLCSTINLLLQIYVPTFSKYKLLYLQKLNLPQRNKDGLSLMVFLSFCFYIYQPYQTSINEKLGNVANTLFY